MLQVKPDWHKSYTAAQFAAEFPKLKFRGPGCYLTDTDTMLVLAHAGPEDHPWKVKWPDEQIFEIYVWNCEVNDTILSSTGPTKTDNRSWN